ncbi:DNA repair protein XRCC3-like isoform X1 [Ceratina calcarata]|uniref:DNA repair protein XRCC3-like isoform X1 n=1 Tax=Ceratina calcarata TaxID=156304 RepID=A0AAJ7ISD7_9HYME|nr:DNA repair protein XRCC3-like isoform X1 [Ceratina calcarata]
MSNSNSLFSLLGDYVNRCKSRSIKIMEDYFESARRVTNREKYLSTGCSKFDELLQGGISNRGITQIYGAAGTGKTQIALQLCLTVQLPEAEGGFSAGAVYICTECGFPSTRLQELLQKLETIKNFGVNGDCIFVEHVSTIKNLETCLLHRVPILMSAKKIGLIIVDSIAAPYRAEDWQDESTHRAQSLRTIGQQLHKLCTTYNICVVCINQVAGTVCSNVLNDNSSEIPALGATWTSMVTNSIQLYRNGSSRYATVKLSSNVPEVTIPFEVQACGIKAVN